MVLSAFSATCSTLVSNIIGEGHQDKVSSLIKRILKLSYAVIMAIVLLFCLFPYAIISIYTDIPDLTTASIPAVVVMCSSYVFTVGGMIYFQAVSGTGSTKTAFRLELAALVIYIIYCTIVIENLKADIAICWTAEHVYAMAILIFSYIYMKSGRWRSRPGGSRVRFR